MAKVPGPLAVPQLARPLCASSGRDWRLWAAWHFQEEAAPLGAQPLPLRAGLERAASAATDVTHHPGLFLFLAICMASKLVVSRSLGSLFLVIYGIYLAFTIATNV